MIASFGTNINGETIEIDLNKEGIRFILLAGKTGSGKSVFHTNLYKKLIERYTSKELGFVFLDMTIIDFNDFDPDYLIRPIISNSEEAIKALNELANEKINRQVVIHIEECDLVYKDRKAVESVLESIRMKENFIVVFSTSRIDRKCFEQWLKRFIDLRVVFSVATLDNSDLLLGDDTAAGFKKLGERVLVFNNQQILCQPFTDNEVQSLNQFRL